jgi:hypothetical protein
LPVDLVCSRIFPVAAIVHGGRIDEQSFHTRQRPLSEDAALLRGLGIAFLSKLEQLSQRTRWPVASEKHKTFSFAMTISSSLSDAAPIVYNHVKPRLLSGQHFAKGSV